MNTADPVTARVSAGWNAGDTVAELQTATGLSRQSVLKHLAAAGIDPKNWRTRNRKVGKALGPVSALSADAQSLVDAYVQKKQSLAVLASTHKTSRSSIRRALVQAGVVMRSRGRPVKPATL